MKEELATRGILGGGAVGTALIFATGCLGTNLLVLLGVSSGALGALSVLEPYRPLLLVVSGVALAAGLWRILRRRRTAQVTGVQGMSAGAEVQR